LLALIQTSFTTSGSRSQCLFVLLLFGIKKTTTATLACSMKFHSLFQMHVFRKNKMEMFSVFAPT